MNVRLRSVDRPRLWTSKDLCMYTMGESDTPAEEGTARETPVPRNIPPHPGQPPCDHLSSGGGPVGTEAGLSLPSPDTAPGGKEYTEETLLPCHLSREFRKESFLTGKFTTNMAVAARKTILERAAEGRLGLIGT